MSEQNAELARMGIEGVNQFMRGEISSDVYAAFFDSDVEVRWHDEQTYPDTPQRLQGVSELVEFSEQWREGWDELDQEPLEITAAANGRVLVLTRQTGRGHQSGVPIEFHYFQLWTIREGKITEIEYFRHRAEALEAAGLSE